MLANLFRSNTNQRNTQHIESVTDDAHTRSLLFGPTTQHVLYHTGSPPPSPFGSPSQRPVSFDDQFGLEIEEKDIRVLLAQDACGGDDRPSLLFDSRKSAEVVGSLSGRKSQGIPPAQERATDGFRNRSSTFSSGQSSWAKTTRNVNSKDDPYLECMFGVPSSTKSASSTKMHIVPATLKQTAAADRLRTRQSTHLEHQRRANLPRALTSGPQSPLPRIEDNERDSLLITRLFHVALDEDSRVANTRQPPTISTHEEPALSPPADFAPYAQWKPPKLVERKVPAFAIGVVIQLPFHVHRPRSSQTRPPLSLSHNQSVTSASSSYGSDLQSSWTFLDAIPASLSSSQTMSDDGDRRVDQIVCNWDVITRSISSVESIAADLVQHQLQIVIKQMTAPQEKIPKEKSMQRINQRMISIHDAHAIASNASLITAASSLSRRVSYAVRIPRVITGLGFTSGHWIDEARNLYWKCGGKQQHFFLFNLMTAFLGNHTQWLEKLAPEWYRKQFYAAHRKPQETKTLASRTIIVSDQKSLARRLVYVLASFLPGRGGIDALQKLGEDHFLNSLLSSSSSLARHTQRPPIQILNKAVTDNQNPSIQMTSGTELSTSASTHDSRASVRLSSTSRARPARKDSNKLFIQGGSILTLPQNENISGRSVAGTTTTIGPNAPTTPVAYISNLRDGYFPENAIAESGDSVASVDLAKVLHKADSVHRRSSSVSSRWGSFVSGISGMLSNKPATPGERASVTTPSQDNSPVQSHRRSNNSIVSRGKSNPLQMMVDELDQFDEDQKKKEIPSLANSALSPDRQSLRPLSSAPRLFVDDKDGVIDVELDLPGFMSFSGSTPPKHLHTADDKARSSHSGRDKDGMYRTPRSLVKQSSHPEDNEPVNVGGYLRRHHEDFILHAVRPYLDLLDDVKNSMKAEPTPQELKDQIIQEASATTWVPVCTTLIADTRQFSIRRLTLRRQYEIAAPRSAGSSSPAHFLKSPSSHTGLILKKEEIADELVMDFDTTLADAIEKALNVGGAGDTYGLSALSTSTNASRIHSRNVSGSTSASVKAATPTPIGLGVAGAADHRDLVVGALEDVVKSVNDDLNKPGAQRENGAPVQESVGKDGVPKQENALREGVKKWMLNVEHASTTTVW